MTILLEVDTPAGTGRWHLDLAPEPRQVLLLGHGSGRGVEAADLAACARLLPARGITVGRFEQPWKAAGRRVAGPPEQLDAAWTAGVLHLLASHQALDLSGPGELPVVLGGRSAGARVACRTASALSAERVVCLSFPLHPPGRPEATRVEELLSAGVPVHVLQGDDDPYGSGDEIETAVGQRALHPIAVERVKHAAHSLDVADRVRPPEEHEHLLAELVLAGLGE